ncbi:hypothetical protein D3C86_1656850 [compost metagenome]
MLAGLEEDDGQVGSAARDQVQQDGRLGAEGGDGDGLAAQCRVQSRRQQGFCVSIAPLRIEACGQGGGVFRRGRMALTPNQPVVAGRGLIGRAEDLIHASPRRGVGAGRQFDRVEAAAAQVPGLIGQNLAGGDQAAAIALIAQDGGQ